MTSSSMNEQLINKLFEEYDMKPPSKVVKAALLEFTIKYSARLLEKAHQVAWSDDNNQDRKITGDDVRLAYDLLHKIGSPELEQQRKKEMSSLVAGVNATQLKTERPIGTTSNLAAGADNESRKQTIRLCEQEMTIKLPLYALRHCMTGKQYQVGLK